MTFASRRVLGLLATMLVLLAAGAAWQLSRPLPGARLSLSQPKVVETLLPGPSPNLKWPAQGSAALYLADQGWVGRSPSQRPQPIASVTKVMTALLTLELHPLAPGAGGPQLVITPAEAASYQAERAVGDSVLAVQAGEVIDEQQLLEGLLIPSGDNIAELLATWDSGSESAFVARMNSEAGQLGMNSTHFADASGLSANTVSTATDLVLLARAAMRYPTFARIVAMPSAQLPVAGVVYNYNALLGTDGISGIKTGWTSSAGGCLLFVADERVSGIPTEIFGAVLGQPGGPESGLVAADRATTALLLPTAASLRRFATGSGSVGVLRTPWGAASSVRPDRRLTALLLGGAAVQATVTTSVPRGELRQGTVVGRITVRLSAERSVVAQLRAETALAGPSVWWRLTRNL